MPDNKCNECGHQHDYDEMDNIIELTGENGETIKVEFLASVKVDDQNTQLCRLWMIMMKIRMKQRLLL